MKAIFLWGGKEIGRLEVVNGKIVTTGNIGHDLIEQLQSGELKVIGPNGQKLPADGDDFIQALPYTFRSQGMTANIEGE